MVTAQGSDEGTGDATKKRGKSKRKRGKINKQFLFWIRDGRKVGNAGKRNAAKLGKFGVVAADVTAHRKLVERAFADLSARGGTEVEVSMAEQAALTRFESARDGLANVKRCARTAFEKPGEEIPEAREPMGIGAGVPGGHEQLAAQVKSIEGALSDHPDWKKRLLSCGVTEAQLEQLAADTEKSGEASGGDSARSAATAALVETLRALRRSTAFIRFGANAAFHGKATLKEFDPPPRPKKKKPAAK